jgi:hypothetical protein
VENAAGSEAGAPKGQALEVGRNGRPTHIARKAPAEQDERDARRRVGPLRLRVPLLIERQLFAEEQVLRRQARAGCKRQPDKRDKVTQ